MILPVVWRVGLVCKIMRQVLFQTLNSISAEKNSTIIFPLPLDVLHNLIR